MRNWVSSQYGFWSSGWSTAGARRDKWLVLLALAAGVPLGFAIGLEDWRIVGVALGLMLVLLFPVEATFGLYAFLIPWEDLTLLSHGASRTTLLFYLGAMSIVVLGALGLIRKDLVRPPSAAMIWSALIAWAALSCFWAAYPDASLKRLPTMFGLWLLYLIAVSVRISNKELSRIIMFAVAGGLAAALFSANQYFHGEGVAGMQGIRATLGETGMEADPNFFAASLLLPLSFAFGDALSARNSLRRLIMLAATGAIALGIFLTMSRGALLSVAVIVCVFAFRLRLNWKVFVPLGVLATAALAMPSLFFERIQRAGASRGSGRLDIWQAGLHALVHHLAIGAGLDNFKLIYVKYAGETTIFRGLIRNPHNLYLGIAVDLGIVGFGLLIIGIAWHLRAVREWRPDLSRWPAARKAALEASCWGMLTAACFLDIEWRKSFWLPWMLIFLAMHARDRHNGAMNQWAQLGDE